MWYRLANPDYRVIYPDSDDDEDNSDQINQGNDIFKENDIRIDSTKNINHLAIENGVVIGALASGWTRHDNEMVFAFDLVVKQEFRIKGVGLQLIQNAIKQYNQEKSDYKEMGHSTKMRIYVVNPLLFPVLERLGFKVVETYQWNGSTYGVAYFEFYN